MPITSLPSGRPSTSASGDLGIQIEAGTPVSFFLATVALLSNSQSLGSGI